MKFGEWLMTDAVTERFDVGRDFAADRSVSRRKKAGMGPLDVREHIGAVAGASEADWEGNLDKAMAAWVTETF